MNSSDIPRAVARLKKLHLIGFAKSEQHSIIELEFGCKLTALNFEDLWSQAQQEFSYMPETAELKNELGQTWSRAEMIQNDLLTIYTGMLRNYDAAQRGIREHDDGTPVVGVRATEIVAVADKIMKIDQERVSSKFNANKLLQVNLSPTGPKVLPTPISNPAAIISSLSDEDDDGEA